MAHTLLPEGHNSNYFTLLLSTSTGFTVLISHPTNTFPSPERIRVSNFLWSANFCNIHILLTPLFDYFFLLCALLLLTQRLSFRLSGELYSIVELYCHLDRDVTTTYISGNIHFDVYGKGLFQSGQVFFQTFPPGNVTPTRRKRFQQLFLAEITEQNTLVYAIKRVLRCYNRSNVNNALCNRISWIGNINHAM